MKTEFVSEAQKILIIDSEVTHLTELLKDALKKYDNEIFISPHIPPSVSPFEICFLIDPTASSIHKLASLSPKHLVIVIPDTNPKAAKLHELAETYKKNRVKIVSITTLEHAKEHDVESILWFTLSQTTETSLYVTHTVPSKKLPVAPKKPIKPHIVVGQMYRLLHPKTIPFLLISLLLIIHLLFVPLLLISFGSLYLGARDLQSKHFSRALIEGSVSQTTGEWSKKVYLLVRPTFLLFSQATSVDSVFQLNEAGYSLVNDAVPLYGEGQRIFDLVMKPDKDKGEITELVSLKNDVASRIDSVQEDTQLIYQKLPDLPFLAPYKTKLKDALSYLDLAQKLLPHFDSFFAKDTTHTYLLLFANNMELRPGGGFIGSYGTVKVHNYTVDTPQVYDVYDADGQLKDHVEPPAPIRDYLAQPNWFLRDSAFSPDFEENYTQAKMFLSREMKLNNLDGGILITTTAIQNLIDAYGSLYIPDYKETITDENFYIKAQLYSEKDFFPGSQQKKKFLGSVMNQLLYQINTASLPQLIQGVKKSLDEKQIVMNFEDPILQKTITSLYWSGQTIQPTCSVSTESCILDYIMPIDANLGVNKANFYIQRNLNSNVVVSSDGTITHTFTVLYSNDAQPNVYPGGTYKNYFQIMIPPDANVLSVLKDNQPVGYNTSQKDYKTLGFLLEVPPQSSSTVKVVYTLSKKVDTGSTMYQLITQKQIGTPNTQFNFSLSLPPRLYVMNQNFSPLVNGNTILYNTTITNDKIFFLELLKE